MGAWGVGVFENDDASDWVYELEQSSDLAVVEQALSDVTGKSGDEEPDTTDSAAALAAAELVAVLRGRPGDGVPDDVTKWVGTVRPAMPAGLAELAAAAVRKVMAGSELKDLWDESGTEQSEEWEAQLEDLLTRLE
jgi:hypothetical protein